MHVYLSLASHAEAVSNGDEPRGKSRQIGLEPPEQLLIRDALLFDCSNLSRLVEQDDGSLFEQRAGN